MGKRVHIAGGSGSGTTTLGAHLALAVDVPHHDTDDYFWIPTTPPYRDKRPVAERLALMDALFLPRDGWVLSGSLMGWGDPLIPYFDLVVFLTLPHEDRMARLKARETAAYGDRIAPGGDMAEAHADFMDWAVRYDDPVFPGRSLKRQTEWCAGLKGPVLRLDSRAPVANLVAGIQEVLAG